ncbi:hypothetical protein TL16_g08422 [Triparma laevis f. inornata]|uniref:Pre-mRNA-splicing factor 38 n=1 Tax=Triparma laevis f. inornata TaxID=1714386 RepID=A0A9W7EIQ3_9STRA|nr:hypothetical protein TL16_g08422 [Triparma laevis f. inornata]
MSRSALSRGANARDQRKTAAQQLVSSAYEQEVTKNALPLFGNTETFNLNSMLYKNITQCSYFLRLCSTVNDFSKSVDEIFYKVKHVLPFTPGSSRDPSSCFCLLIFTMLNHLDSPYIRCVGFLYVRFTLDPKDLWPFFKDYIYDVEEFEVKPGLTLTMGEFVSNLITSLDYYSTILPRLPVLLARQMKVKLLRAGEEESRAVKNLTMMEEFRAGKKCHALYEDEENPLAWYECMIDEVMEPKQEWERPKFVVTFLEYGNTEEVTLGMMGNTPDTISTNEQLMAKVVDIEKSKVAASGRDYARIPMGLKGALALKVEGEHMTNKKMRPMDEAANVVGKGSGGGGGSQQQQQQQPQPPQKRERTAEEVRRANEKRQKLAESYG